MFKPAAGVTAAGFLAVAVLAAAPSSSLRSTAASAATAATAPCVPNRPAPGVLPVPPTIDTAKTPKFTIWVDRGKGVGTAPNLTYPYCYVDTDGGATAYVEAPTIRVKQGATFTMTLVNRIPRSGPAPSPAPSIIPADGDCAWLPDDGPLPTPNPQMTPGGYFEHARVPQHAMPPWMLDNDTNFHTHGWHVSPYVDNVFKSLAYAEPTANTCVYVFTVRSSQPPGTYWYHAHLHGLSNAQVGGGLAGALIVETSGAAEPPSTLLVIKNAPVRGTPAPALKAMGGMAMPGMGGSNLEAHYDAIVGRAPFRGLRKPAAAPPTPIAFAAFSPPPWRSGFPLPGPQYCPAQPTTLGDATLLAVNGAAIPTYINGKPIPAIGPRVSQIRGTTRRYRIVNAAANAYVNVETVDDAGNIIPLVVAGRDGVPVNWNLETGRIDPSEPPTVVEPNVFVPPSGRVDIDVTAFRPLTIISAEGTTSVTSKDGTPFCTGYVGSAMSRLNILRVQPLLAAGAPHLMATAPAVQQHQLRSAAAVLVQNDAPKVTTSRAITFTMYPEGCCNWNVTETGVYAGRNPPPSVKALPFTERPFWLAPGANPPDPKYPYVPWIRVPQHAVEEWYLYNATPEIHAFHIHQLSFVAEYSPFEATNPYQQVFLDTIALPAAHITRPGVTPPGSYPVITPSLTKILIDFRNVDPGVFVFHCHMLFHEDHGMMGIVEVVPGLKAGTP
ncbi:MAG TPA: multicopper oxidase domain-containing protein [Candidatus Elarobacter sp.]